MGYLNRSSAVLEDVQATLAPGETLVDLSEEATLPDDIQEALFGYCYVDMSFQEDCQACRFAICSHERPGGDVFQRWLTGLNACVFGPAA